MIFRVCVTPESRNGTNGTAPGNARGYARGMLPRPLKSTLANLEPSHIAEPTSHAIRYSVGSEGKADAADITQPT